MSRVCELMGTGRLVGNNVSKSNRKTRRTFLPNLIEKQLVSNILKKTFNLKITTRTARTIAKHGSLDDFLINVKKANLTEFAVNLKQRILKISPEALKQMLELRAPKEKAIKSS